MPQLRLTADLVTFNATLRALERGLCWQMVLEVFEDMPKARSITPLAETNSETAHEVFTRVITQSESF